MLIRPTLVLIDYVNGSLIIPTLDSAVMVSLAELSAIAQHGLHATIL